MICNTYIFLREIFLSSNEASWVFFFILHSVLAVSQRHRVTLENNNLDWKVILSQVFQLLYSLFLVYEQTQCLYIFGNEYHPKRCIKHVLSLFKWMCHDIKTYLFVSYVFFLWSNFELPYRIIMNSYVLFSN